MKFELKTLPRNSSDEEIIAEIKRVDSIVGKDILSRRDFDKHSKINSTTICNRFGNSTWKDALIRAELGHKYGGLDFISEKVKQKKSNKLTNDEIIAELRNIAKIANKEEITTDDIKNYSKIIGPAVIRARFGSWKKGLEKAGLKSSIHGHRHSIEDYFENLLNVWTHYGRQPLYREMNLPPSQITVEGYRSRFGNWGKALEAFVSEMNREENLPVIKEKSLPIKIVEKHQEINKQSITIADRRQIPLGLRYKVLSRDNFKCVRCGRSPATNPEVELHIDHKVPFSLEGKTIFENLETKCKECNLGKSNRHLE